MFIDLCFLRPPSLSIPWKHIQGQAEVIAIIEMADEEQVLPIPNLALQQHLFILLRPDESKATIDASRSALLKGIEEDEMAPYYSSIINSPDAAIAKVLKRDDALLKKLEEKNKETIDLMDKQLKINEENEGETEVNQVLRQKAAYLAKIGDKSRSIEAHKVAIEKAAGLGSKLDLTMSLVRIGLFHGEPTVTMEYIEKAKA